MNKLLNGLLLLGLLILGACGDKCEDACFTPPANFIFRLVDMSTDEDMFANGSLNEDEVRFVNQVDESDYDFDFISEGDYSFLNVVVGWDTEIVTLDLMSADSVLFTFYVDAERKMGDCCSFTLYNKVSVENVDYDYDASVGIYTILLEP